MLINSYNQKEQIEHRREIAAVERFIQVLIDSKLTYLQAKAHLTKEEMTLFVQGSLYEKLEDEARRA